MRIGAAITATALTVLFGCATPQPTPYTPRNAEGFGYSVKEQNGMAIANFTGNKDTPVVHAYAFSILAAIDECSKKQQFAVVAKAINQSTEVNYSDVYAQSAMDHNARASVPLSAPQPPKNSSSAKLELYPSFAEAFECRTNLHQMAGLPLTENIRADLVNPITKDKQGGVLLHFELGHVSEGVQDDDVVVMLDGKRTANNVEFYQAIDSAKVGKVLVRVIRNNQLMTVWSKLLDATKDLRDVERQTIDLMCNAIGIEVDELANIPAAAKAKPTVDESKLTPAEAIEYKSGKELCGRLRALNILHKKI